MGFTVKRLGDVMSEFASALMAGETYSPLRNPYIWFGFLWGIPVPLLGLIIHRHLAGGHLTEPLAGLVAEPLFMFLLLHPPLFAVVFGAMGTVRLRKIASIEALLAEREVEMQQIRDAHAELQQMARLKDEFLGSVTHELKTPLVTIRGYAEMLEHGRLGDVSDKQKHVLGVMQRNCRRLQQQIDMLLSASRNQSPQAELKPVDFPLQDLVDEICERHRPNALQRSIELTCEAPPPGIQAHGDYGRLAEVFDNLLSNALKFTDSGGWVRLSFGAPHANRLPCEVADAGCGIPAEAQRYIFERFRQADGSIRRRYGGSGLGLALVKENLAAHGCAVTVESAPGEGARFRFDLPIRPAPAADVAGGREGRQHGDERENDPDRR
ncbi:MAG: HAMP domain-containing histidine kinase [Lentisphaerae bacterium]|nr:HAMP domain-containing histidine kinase [Lentisphaerota bacterium]